MSVIFIQNFENFTTDNCLKKFPPHFTVSEMSDLFLFLVFIYISYPYIWMHSIQVNYNTNDLENSTGTEKGFKLLRTGRKWNLLIVTIGIKCHEIMWKHANEMYIRWQEF